MGSCSQTQGPAPDPDRRPTNPRQERLRPDDTAPRPPRRGAERPRRAHQLRFDQHEAGYKASSAVRRFGVRLLPELVQHLNPRQGWESLELEADLAELLRAAGIVWVERGH
jgi:hypothetical protein